MRSRRARSRVRCRPRRPASGGGSRKCGRWRSEWELNEEKDVAMKTQYRLNYLQINVLRKSPMLKMALSDDMRNLFSSAKVLALPETYKKMKTKTANAKDE